MSDGLILHTASPRPDELIPIFSQLKKPAFLTDSVHRTAETVGRAKRCRTESRFRLSARITLKDVGRQHGRIRGFAEEPAVVQVPLDLQEDEVPAKRRVAESGVWR